MKCRHTIFQPKVPANRSLDINPYYKKERDKEYTYRRQDNIQRPVNVFRVVIIGNNPRRGISIRIGTCCIPHIVEKVNFIVNGDAE
jgi:hypothetical protein